MNRLRVAVVGGGALGRHHARILSEFADVHLVAIAEVNPISGQSLAEKCGTRWVADYREILHEVDAAVIAVPTFAHCEIACDFLERGVALLVEKPIAADVNQAQHMVALAEQHSALLQVGHVERFNSATKTAWPLLGQPKYIKAERFSPYAFRSTDISVVHDVMIHDLDLVLAAVQSPVKRVEAFGVSLIGGLEDAVQARLYFESGCVADVSANRVSPSSKRNMLVWSATGCTNIDFASREVTHYTASDALKYGTPLLERAAQPGANIESLKSEMFGTFIKVAQPTVAARDALSEELHAFVDCVQQGKRPLVGGAQALEAMLVAEQVLTSVAQHQWDGHADGAVGPTPQTAKRHKRAG